MNTRPLSSSATPVPPYGPGRPRVPIRRTGRSAVCHPPPRNPSQLWLYFTLAHEDERPHTDSAIPDTIPRTHEKAYDGDAATESSRVRPSLRLSVSELHEPTAYACTLLLLLARRSSTQCRRRLDHLRAVPCEAPSPQALDLDHGVHVDLVLLDQPLLARLEPDRLEGVRHSG